MAELTRKELLAGAAVGAGVVAGCGGGSKRAAPAALDPRDWASVRDAFALDRRQRHFTAFLLAAHPRPVREAIERHRGGLDRDAAGYLHANQARLEAAVASEAARYLGVRDTDLAFTDSTTMGLGLVYGGMRLRGEIVTTEHDHYATHEALRLRAARDGVRVRRIRLYDDPARASRQAIVDAVRRGVSARTRLLALTWVHSGTGVKLPLREIAAELAGERRRGLLIVVDGVHGLGVEDLSPGIDACDVFVAGCHKWLGGPRGTGLVWSIKAWDALRPTIPTFDGASYLAWMDGRPPPFDAPPGPTFTPGGFHAFEHRWALAEAFAFQRAIGRARVAARIHGLAARLKRGLAGLDRVRLVTPADASVSSGLVCFDVDGLPAPEAVRRLAREHRISASVTPYATEHVRLGCGLQVLEADVDAAVEAVRALA
jgi:selenocysteine lyase/cysteine desulfurase